MSVIDTVTTNSDSSQTQSNASDILAGLVGEGKKYRDIEALATSRVEADTFIEQLKRENASMRDELKRDDTKMAEQKTLTDIIEALKQTKSPDGGNQPPVSLEELTKLVKSTLSQTKEEEARSINRNLVDQSLVAKYGTVDEAAKQVRQKASELGLGAIQIKELSESSPAAFLQLFGATSKTPPSTTTVKGNVNAEAMALIPDNGERKYTYYKALRQKMGRTEFYADQGIMRQMSVDMSKFGDSFMNT